MDERVLRPVTTSFDETWPTYSFAGRVRFVLRVAERLRGKRPPKDSEAPETEPVPIRADGQPRPTT